MTIGYFNTPAKGRVYRVFRILNIEMKIGILDTTKNVLKFKAKKLRIEI